MNFTPSQVSKGCEIQENHMKVCSHPLAGSDARRHWHVRRKRRSLLSGLTCRPDCFFAGSLPTLKIYKDHWQILFLENKNPSSSPPGWWCLPLSAPNSWVLPLTDLHSALLWTESSQIWRRPCRSLTLFTHSFRIFSEGFQLSSVV